MRCVGAFEAKTHFSQLVDEVNRTREPIIVQRRGRNVAILEPYAEKSAANHDNQVRNILEAFSEIRSSQTTGHDVSIRELIDEGRR